MPRCLRPVGVLSLLVLSVAVGCGETPPEPPPPDAWGTLTGPGGPQALFEDGALWKSCAHLDGGEEDSDHHNLVVMIDGYLLLPWAPEYSGGGLSFFEFSNPCEPVKVGEAYDGDIRESHTLSFSRVDGRLYVAVDYHGGLVDGEIVGGVQIWDITDVTAPAPVASLALLDYAYPDAYARVSLATFWQGPYLYVSGADNGFWIVDASDPTQPQLAAHIPLDPLLRVGAVHVIGNLAMVSTAEGARTLLMDVSEPLQPGLLPGGEFLVSDGDGTNREYYFANIGGRYALFARKDGGGGFVAYDLSDPMNPIWAGEYVTEGNGGYVFRRENHIFVGDSKDARVFDIASLAAPSLLGEADLEGDLDTATPVGNVVVLSVDDEALPGQASSVVPYTREPDLRGPQVEFSSPSDGAIFQALSSRIGVSFDEMVEFPSVFAGSFRVTDAAGFPVAGSYNAQETIVNFTPDTLLAEDTTYVVTIPSGGIIDVSGNAVSEEFRFRFSTGAELAVEAGSGASSF